MSLEGLRTRSSHKLFEQNVSEIMKFIREVMPGAQRIEQRVLLHLGVRILCEYLAKWGVATSHAVVIRNFSKLPSMFDRAFPGYAAMGLLGMVIKQEMSNVRKK
jgi:hypothetical protein